MKFFIKNLILSPLFILNDLASVYFFLVNNVKNGLGNYWLDQQAYKNRSIKQLITHQNIIYNI